jgi:hypothetical protein
MVDSGPRDVGQVLSDAASLLRRRIRPYFAVALPFSAVELALREAGSTLLSVVVGAGVKGFEGPGLDAAAVAPRAAAAVGCWLAWLLVGQLLGCALVRMTWDALQGGEPAPRAGLSALARKAPVVLATSCAWLAILVVGSASPLIVPAVLAALEWWFAAGVAAALAVLASIVVGVVLLLRFAMWLPVVVLEERAGLGALRGSARVMASRGEPFVEGAKFRFSVLFLVYFAAGSSLQLLFVAPRYAFGAPAGGVFGGVPPLASLPFAALVPLAFVEVALNALVVPFASIMSTVFYWDARARDDA